MGCNRNLQRTTDIGENDRFQYLLSTDAKIMSSTVSTVMYFFDSLIFRALYDVRAVPVKLTVNCGDRGFFQPSF